MTTINFPPQLRNTNCFFYTFVTSTINAMNRSIFSFILIFYTLVCFGQNTSIPASIQVPPGSKLIRHSYAKGVQIYVCIQDAKDTSHYIWLFTEPRAMLYADSSHHQYIGRHYFERGKNPVWEYKDGSKITGVKLQQADAPDNLGVPWLLLKAGETGGTGALKSVAFIQRLYTKGGKAPATAGKSQKGHFLEVPYTAEYFFYSEK
jgi:hypothetical protein